MSDWWTEQEIYGAPLTEAELTGGDRPEFPEMIRRFGNTPTLPTEPGLYIVRQEFHSENWWAAAVFRRTLQGFWEMDRNPVTVDELVTILGPRALVRLIPVTEQDV